MLVTAGGFVEGDRVFVVGLHFSQMDFLFMKFWFLFLVMLKMHSLFGRSTFAVRWTNRETRTLRKSAPWAMNISVVMGGIPSTMISRRNKSFLDSQDPTEVHHYNPGVPAVIT